MKMPSLTWLAQSVERGSNKVRIQKRTNKYKTYSNIQSPFKTTAQGHGFDPRIEYFKPQHIRFNRRTRNFFFLWYSYISFYYTTRPTRI